MIKHSLAVLAVCIAPSISFADSHIDNEKALVLGCLELVGDKTEWTQCANQMFKPCAAEEVESEGHIACLLKERDDWRETFRVEQATLNEMLVPENVEELKGILTSWVRYSDQKCQAASLERGGSLAALHGCEIAEVISATAELFVCRQGASTAPFCKMKSDDK